MPGALIGALRVTLGLDSAEFERGSRKAQREVNTLSGQMSKAAKAIGGALTGMVAWEAVQTLRDWTRAAVDSAGALGEQAKALGVSTDALQEYRYAATQVGLEADEMDQALAQLTRRLGDATLAGKGPVVEALEKLGITLADIKGKSAGDVIPLIADGMKGLATDTERAAVAVDLFGKSGQKLSTLLSGGATEVNKLREAAHELGIVLSEGDIAKADEVADKLAKLNYVIEAQKNKKLLENADALMKFDQQVGDLKLSLIEFVNWLDAHPPEMVEDWIGRVVFGVEPGQTIWSRWAEQARSDGAVIHKFAQDVVGWYDAMVAGIRTRVIGTLDAVWDHAAAKIDWIKGKFHGLYDAVVGHSYIPDMVDGIAAHMARLDAVMVDPATKATKATADQFRALRDDLDRLFPEVGKAGAFNASLSRIQGSAMNDNQKDEAVARLWREYTGGSPFGGGGMGEPDFGDAGPLVEGIDKTKEAIEGLTEKSKIGTVKIAKSFADMATSTLESLGQLTQAIKGGGFLDILTSVANVALQLGQAGAFGSKVSGFLNQPPAYASGTNFHPGGLALVGERGPELVSMPRGSRVTPNRALGGAPTVNVYANDAVLAETVRGWVAEGVGIAIKGGAQAGVAKIQRMRDRALA